MVACRIEDGRIVLDHGECCEILPSLAESPSREGTIYIYAMADPLDGIVRYIGKSIRPRERLTNHCNDRQRCHRTNWIRSMLRSGRRSVIGILDRMASGTDWQTIEQRWIKYGRESGWPLVNETDGGDGVVNLSAEARTKLSKRFKGKPLSESHRRKVGRKGRQHSDATKAKMSAAHTGRVFTDEWRAKISKALTGNMSRPRKLTVEDAAEIIRKVASGQSRQEVAAEYGIHKRTVWLVTSGRWCLTTIGKQESRNAAE